MTVTVQEVIDRARSRHWAFSDGNDGAALHFLNEQQRKLLLSIIRTAEERLGETSQIDVDITADAAVVAVDSTGAPYFTTTTDPGYIIRFSGGVPYIDVSDPFIVDPFGIDGDTPGLPLPDDILRISSISAMTLDNTVVPRPVDVVTQEIARGLPVRVGLRAFISANRLIPLRSDSADLWSRVTSIRLAFVRCPELTALTDEIIVPSQCVDALTAKLTEFFALQTQKCPQQDKTRFTKQADQAFQEVVTAVDTIEGVTASTVIYKR